jgi:inositol oxygenase
MRKFDETQDKVRALYKEKRRRQTYDMATRLRDKYCRFDDPTRVMSIKEALQRVAQIKDLSDPDLIDVSNDVHAYQTAYSMLQDPECTEEMVVLSLIHDLGKILYLWGNDDDGTSVTTQWAVVGDDFITGHPLPLSCVYPEFNELNPEHSVLSRYPQGVGLTNTVRSFGHDEYLYQVLMHNRDRHRLSPESLYIIRHHSLYPWHKDSAYTELEDGTDRVMKPYVQKFQKHDLYSKQGADTCVAATNWNALIDRYFTDDLQW